MGVGGDFCFRGRAAHAALQVNGNHWLRLNLSLLDEADIFMYSSQLVCSMHLQMQTLIPPRLCFMLILLEYFTLRASRSCFLLSSIPLSVPLKLALRSSSASRLAVAFAHEAAESVCVCVRA